MTIFMISEYVVRPDKAAENVAWMKKYEAWAKSQSELFKEVKSIRLFAQTFGGIAGGYVEMWEFESLADLEKWLNRYYMNKEAAVWHQEWLALIVPETWTLKIWNFTADLHSHITA